MPHSICHAPLATQRMSYSLRTNRKSIKKLNYKSFGGSDDPEEKNIKPLPKTCGDGAKTTYGAPHGDEEFEIGHVVNLAFNDRTKSFEFEVEHFFPNDDTTHLYWVTWYEMNTFPQYQISLWFYLRNTITQMSPDGFETTFPSSSAAALVRDEMEEA